MLLWRAADLINRPSFLFACAIKGQSRFLDKTGQSVACFLVSFALTAGSRVPYNLKSTFTTMLRANFSNVNCGSTFSLKCDFWPQPNQTRCHWYRWFVTLYLIYQLFLPWHSYVVEIGSDISFQASVIRHSMACSSWRSTREASLNLQNTGTKSSL